MATRDRVLQRALSTTAAEEAPALSRSVAAQSGQVAIKQAGSLSNTLTKAMFRERQANLEAATDLAEAATEMLGRLRTAKGEDRRAMLDAYAKIKVALINNLTDLGAAQMRMNTTSLQEATAVLNQGGDASDYWQTLAGSLAEAGNIRNDYPGLPQIINQALQEQGGGANLTSIERKDVPALVASLGLPSGSELEARVRNMFYTAWDASRTTVDAQRMLSMVNEMPDFGDGSGADVSDEAVVQATDGLAEVLEDAKGMYRRDALSASADLEDLYETNSDLAYYKSLAERANKYAFSDAGEADDAYRRRMALMVSNPEFRAWAEDYGYELGEAYYRGDDDYNWTPTKDDTKAVLAFNQQIRHPDRPVRLFSPSRFTRQSIVARVPAAAFKNAEGVYYKKPDGTYVTDDDLGSIAPTSPVRGATDADGRTLVGTDDQVYVVGEDGTLSPIEAPSESLQWAPLFVGGAPIDPTTLAEGGLLPEGVEQYEVDPSDFASGAVPLPSEFTPTTEPPPPEVLYGREVRRKAGQTSLSGKPGEVGADETLLATRDGIRRVDLTGADVTLIDPKASRQNRREEGLSLRGARRTEKDAARAGIDLGGGRQAPAAPAAPAVPASAEQTAEDRIRSAASRFVRPKPAAPRPQAPAAAAPVAPALTPELDAARARIEAARPPPSPSAAAPLPVVEAPPVNISEEERAFARTWYQKGLTAAAEGRFDDAIRAFEVSNRTVPDPATQASIERAKADAARAPMPPSATKPVPAPPTAQERQGYEGADAATVDATAQREIREQNKKNLAEAMAAANPAPKQDEVNQVIAGKSEEEVAAAQAMMRDRFKRQLASAMAAAAAQRVRDAAQPSDSATADEAP